MKQLMAVVALVAAFAVPVAAAAPRTVEVTGTGSVRVVPDAATIAAGVVTRAVSLRAAVDATAARSARVNAALKAAGVAERDLRTEAVSIDPIHAKGGRILAYRVTTSVSAIIRNLDRLPEVIAAAVAAGANRISGPNFLVTRGDLAYQHALDIAFDKAKAKAKRLAARAGSRLGRVLSILEGERPEFSREATVFVPPSSLPIERGSLTIEATVTVTFALA